MACLRNPHRLLAHAELQADAREHPGSQLQLGIADARAHQHGSRLLVDRGLDGVNLAAELLLGIGVDRDPQRLPGGKPREIDLRNAKVELDDVDLVEPRDVGARPRRYAPSLTWRRPATPVNGAVTCVLASFASSSRCLASERAQFERCFVERLRG